MIYTHNSTEVGDLHFEINNEKDIKSEDTYKRKSFMTK